MNEQDVRLAARMCEMRDAARSISGEAYKSKVAEWKSALGEISEKLHVDPMQAVPMICSANPVSGIDAMWLIAAAVEITEENGRIA